MGKIKKCSKGLLFVLILILTFSAIATTAYFTDRETEAVTIKTATFEKGGYKLTREAPNYPFAAGETIEAVLKESNSNTSMVKSVINMSIAWNCPDPAVEIFGNANAADNAVIKVGETIITASEHNLTVDNEGNVTFNLPAHVLSASSVDNLRLLKVILPESLYSTGSLDFTFNEVTVSQYPRGFSAKYSASDLNAEEELDFSVRVGWAASNMSANNGKNLMGFLYNTSVPGEYEIKFSLEFGCKESAMKDFAGKDFAKWSNYKDSVTKLTFVEGMTSFGDYAFPDFEKVTAITIPETITAVGTYAFDNTSIKTLIIPEAVASFETMSFGHINELTEITFDAGTTKDISFPAKAGAETGAFYVYPYVDTTINGTNTDALAYDWIKDLRNPPTLAPSSSWVDCEDIGSFNNPITYVEFVTRYTPTGNETAVWNAAVDRDGDGLNDNDVICYLNGTELTIYANICK